jgi:hypothetical protein
MSLRLAWPTPGTSPWLSMDEVIAREQKAAHKSPKFVALVVALTLWHFGAEAGDRSIDLRGIAVVPHIQSSAMRYRREPDRSLGA